MPMPHTTTGTSGLSLRQSSDSPITVITRRFRTTDPWRSDAVSTFTHPATMRTATSRRSSRRQSRSSLLTSPAP